MLSGRRLSFLIHTFFLVGFVASLLTVFVTSVNAAAPTKVVISFAILSEREAALFVARDQGFFRKQGLDVELVYVANAPVALASLAHGGFQQKMGRGGAGEGREKEECG